ncbi:hypothetical protein LOAG_02234 [Loa loa]|uniref:Uncharacterized protein n=1 Tax=Loa loa TaxID=7209 RepID=A0A1S0U6X4_LOALO|nr:hypothetical protein LOAG_02234 [Loa loa]EFO26251.1 hypothetical protein LOAG_02234 [Loa loa]
MFSRPWSFRCVKFRTTQSLKASSTQKIKKKKEEKEGNREKSECRKTQVASWNLIKFDIHTVLCASTNGLMSRKRSKSRKRQRQELRGLNFAPIKTVLRQL